ncbi:putative GNAT family acetyltransferase [Kribbella sp. VKM Ac-2566]|nr:putative GNAT family acetyltransferase [Kribbella sp. VKM Ac-2566]
MSNEAQASAAEELIDNTEQGRFELYRGPTGYALRHTEVEPTHQHQGVAGAMLRRVLDEVRTREATITAICPFVADYLSRTTTYADLLDPKHQGYPDRATAEAAQAKAARQKLTPTPLTRVRPHGGGRSTVANAQRIKAWLASVANPRPHTAGAS